MDTCILLSQPIPELGLSEEFSRQSGKRSEYQHNVYFNSVDVLEKTAYSPVGAHRKSQNHVFYTMVYSVASKSPGIRAGFQGGFRLYFFQKFTSGTLMLVLRVNPINHR
jgi:hypothetical protein